MAEKVKSVFKGDVSKSRLEFLFDGIFAIAMTILVLELKLQEQIADKRSVHDLGVALLLHWRTFLSYIISFIILSSFWIAHNSIYAKIARITKTLVAVHIWMLAWAAFVPFCAQLIGRYPSNPLAMFIYFTAAFAYTLGLLGLVIIAGKGKLFDPSVPAVDVRKLRRGLIRSLAALLFFSLYYFFIFPVLK